MKLIPAQQNHIHTCVPLLTICTHPHKHTHTLEQKKDHAREAKHFSRKDK
uniref:Uncharacterized protein n=1 Tax=Anguilla anguilla TaxID=7936 RepID=A0A0E9WHC3_ANGAN